MTEHYDAIIVGSGAGKYISPDTWYDADGKPFQPQVHYDEHLLSRMS